MSDRVTSEEMDEGNCEMPGPIGNEMLEENAGDNEMTDDGNTRENEDDGNTCENEDRSIVDGESYASRAARTVSFGERPRRTAPVSNENSMPQRPKSAFFTPSRATTARSVFDALVSADIDHTEIHCLQRKLNGEVVVTFKTIAAKEKFLRLNSLHVNSENYALQDVDRPLTFLTIYDTPFELSDLAIIKRLAPFCEVLHYRRGKHSLAPNIYNGLRHYRVRVIKPIPNYLRFGRYQIYIKYSGQIPTCRKCNLPGHFSNVCPNKICFNCENIGHEARDCPLPTLCCICKEEGHRGIGCDYSWVFPCTRGIPTDEDSDVAIESSDDGMSDYGRGEVYASLASVPPASNETIEEPTSVPATDPPSTDNLLPPSFDDSPSHNILDSQGLLIPSEAPPKPPPRRLPARLSSLPDSLAVCSRKPTSPALVSGKPRSASPDPPASSSAPLLPDSQESDMEAVMDLKRKSSDSSPKRSKKGKSRTKKAPK